MAVLLFALVVVGVLVVCFFMVSASSGGVSSRGAKPGGDKRRAVSGRADSSGQKAGRRESPERAYRAKPHAAVKIRPGRNPCVAAIKSEGRVVLSVDANALPLPGCDAARCNCRYQHLDDRREDDRRSPYPDRNSMILGAVVDEKRSSRNRRGK